MWIFPGASCNRDLIPLEVKTDLEVPALLLSEIQAERDPATLGHCPIKIINRSSQPQKMKLLRSGCSCYGVSLDGAKLTNGEVFSIPSKGTRTAQIDFRPAESHSEKFYTTDLSTILPNGKSHLFSVKCRLRVFADMRLTPSVITVDAIPQQAVSADQQISIEHIYRGTAEEQGTPDFSDLPPTMTVSNLKKAGPPEKLTEVIWKQIWTALVHVELPADREEMTTPLKYNVRLKGGKPAGALAAHGSLMVHTRQTVAFPNRVNFGKIDLGETRSRRILLSSTEETIFRLQCDSSQLPAGVHVDFNDHLDLRHLVTLSITPHQPGPFSEVVKLQTDLYDFREIAVRVEGIVE